MTLAEPMLVATTETASAAGTCPTAMPDNGVAPDWTLPGSTGSVAVTGSTDTTAPRVKVDAPFSVAQTQVDTLRAGDGPVVATDGDGFSLLYGSQWA